MSKVLFLTHRFPYPANKGDKIRALNILEHLAAKHEVFLGCVDGDSDGRPTIEWATQQGYKVYCGSSVTTQRLPRTLLSLVNGEPLSTGYFYHHGLHRWVENVRRSEQPELIYVFSSAMAQYALKGRPTSSRLIMDFVDVDSVKWRQYAATRKAPASWIYSLEAQRLLAHDRAVAKVADASLFVSTAELELFKSIAPECAQRLHVVPNGVDTIYFSPASRSTRNHKIVFVGVMDYWPNVEAVQWFAAEVLPLVLGECPNACFQIVGSKPNAAVRGLAALDRVEVTGAVPDIRPFLESARVVVAPLRIARGIQNKVLEAMAMARPVVTTPEALEGIPAQDKIHALVASGATAFAHAVIRCLSEPDQADEMGARARDLAVNRFGWAAQLKTLDKIVDGTPS